jgi:cobalt-zinc-cadmium efflux system membrane fusion protein
MQMNSRIGLIVLALLIGAAAGSVIPGVWNTLRQALGLVSESSAEQSIPSANDKHQDTKQASIALSPDQIESAGIETVAAQPSTLARRIVVPGTIIPHANRIAHVSVKLTATVAELLKKIGDRVEKGELIAILESREVADAKSEYLAAKLTNELQQDLAQRDKELWDKRSAPEQQYIRSRNLAAQARMRFDIARQKLLPWGWPIARSRGCLTSRRRYCAVRRFARPWRVGWRNAGSMSERWSDATISRPNFL